MISIKMGDKLPSRSAGRAISMLLLFFLTGAVSSATGRDTRWLMSLQQHGWSLKDLINKVEHGHATTYEVGKPNYQILNPEDEPVYITEDHPQYHQMLSRLTSNVNGSDTIDLNMYGVKAVAPTPITDLWDKLRQRRTDSREEEKLAEMPIEQLEEQSTVKTFDEQSDESTVKPVDEQTDESTVNTVASSTADEVTNQTVDRDMDTSTEATNSQPEVATEPADEKVDNQ